MKKRIVISALFLTPFLWALSGTKSFAQNRNIDSLQTLLKKDKPDTGKINHFNKLCDEYKFIGLHDTALHCANNALQLAYQLVKQNKNPTELPGIQKIIANSYSNIGNVYSMQADYPRALDYYLKALKINEELKNKKGRATLLGNIGLIYQHQGNYPQALDYGFSALKIAEELGDKNEIAMHLSNIGIVYLYQGDYPKALDCFLRAVKAGEALGDKNLIAHYLGNIGIVYWNQADFAKALDYYSKALKMMEELGDKEGIAKLMSNIGIVYYDQRDYPKALDYYFKALKMAEELGNKKEIAAGLSDIANVYNDQASYSKALEYYFKVLKMTEESGDKNLIAATLGNISSVYTSLKKYKKSSDYVYRSLALFDSIGARNYVKNCYYNLSELYEKSNIPLQDSLGGKILTMEQTRLRSLYYYKRSIEIRDTLFSQENKKQLVRKEMNYEFDKKEAITKAETEKQQAIAEEKNRRQKIITWSVAFGLLLVIIFAGFVFRSLHTTRKQKNIIEVQKNEVFQQKEIVEKQKRLVEEHQKEIIDSITYAKRLQEAILPPIAYVNELLPDNFILYKPKDIVAGDFYWMEEVKSFEPGKGDVVFIAAADCTGHGVPGAMVSMVCSNALNRAVKEFHLCDTGKILDKATDLVLETFEKSDKDVKDGMDISLLRIEFVSSPSGNVVAGLHWSGANNPLWYISSSSDGESHAKIRELNADKQPIGKQDNRKPFTSHTIEISNIKHETIFYLFTDGYADQFGGTKGKKFMYKQFKELLLSIHHLPMKEQQSVLEKTIMHWRGQLEQVDDILVIGIRV